VGTFLVFPQLILEHLMCKTEANPRKVSFWIFFKVCIYFTNNVRSSNIFHEPRPEFVYISRTPSGVLIYFTNPVRSSSTFQEPHLEFVYISRNPSRVPINFTNPVWSLCKPWYTYLANTYISWKYLQDSQEFLKFSYSNHAALCMCSITIPTARLCFFKIGNIIRGIFIVAKNAVSCSSPNTASILAENEGILLTYHCLCYTYYLLKAAYNLRYTFADVS
jgi:hypothetical protein